MMADRITRHAILRGIKEVRTRLRRKALLNTAVGFTLIRDIVSPRHVFVTRLWLKRGAYRRTPPLLERTPILWLRSREPSPRPNRCIFDISSAIGPPVLRVQVALKSHLSLAHEPGNGRRKVENKNVKLTLMFLDVRACVRQGSESKRKE